jgi:acetyltransferase-like isoleucine patch superfamily enzyme
MDESFKSNFLTKVYFVIRTLLHYNLSFRKKFSRIGGPPVIWGVWNIDVNGPNISIGENVVMVGAKGSRTTLTTAKLGDREGGIEIGNNVLIMNGVRISSATKIVINDDCMLANFCYLSDADWHDIHDRTMPVGRTLPIVLEKGAWIGDSAIVLKGVTIGQNSIVGAGSVVTKNVPPNVIVAGNPARVVRKLDPEKIVTMSAYVERLRSLQS